MKKSTRSFAFVVPLAACALGIFVACGSSTGSDLFSTDGGPDSGIRKDGCPTAVPRAGTSCIRATNDSCSYGCDEGGPATATCDTGVWRIGHFDMQCAPPVEAGTNNPPPRPRDAGTDSGLNLPPAPAPFACGNQTCGINQYCVHPCCGGAGPQCLASLADGGCPAGAFPSNCTPQIGTYDGGPACAKTCTPPPARCEDNPEPGCFPRNDGTRHLECVCP